MMTLLNWLHNHQKREIQGHAMKQKLPYEGFIYLLHQLLFNQNILDGNCLLHVYRKTLKYTFSSISSLQNK